MNNFSLVLGTPAAYASRNLNDVSPGKSRRVGGASVPSGRRGGWLAGGAECDRYELTRDQIQKRRNAIKDRASRLRRLERSELIRYYRANQRLGAECTFMVQAGRGEGLVVAEGVQRVHERQRMTRQISPW
jgi:hypothetical protein